MLSLCVKEIEFDIIQPVWRERLWPGRVSVIETHSAMTWPFEGDPAEYDMGIFEYPATFWAVYDADQIVGVNSGHRTSDTQYRSRGIWVDPDYRGQGIAGMLFQALEDQAVAENCLMIWSIPRKSALSAYTKFGFAPVGEYIQTETSESNIYARKYI